MCLCRPPAAVWIRREDSYSVRMETSMLPARVPTRLLRYNGTTGAFLGVFVAANSGALDGPQGLTFAADGDLYVASKFTDNIPEVPGPWRSVTWGFCRRIRDDGQRWPR